MGTSSIETVGQNGLPGFRPIGPSSVAQDEWPGFTRNSDPTQPVSGQEKTDPANGKQPPAHSEAAGKSVKKEGKSGELSEEQQREVDKLKARDQEVKAHEMAHMAAGGQYAGSATYSYQTGPDGKRYAIGGEVSIDTSPIKDDPSATVRKMEVVQRAALAPAEPSGQDLAVAAAAAQEQAKASAEARQSSSGATGDSGGSSQQTDKSQKTDTPDNKINAKKDKNLRYTVNSQNNAPVMITARKSSQYINVMA
jgi:hypothetical protein